MPAGERLSRVGHNGKLTTGNAKKLIRSINTEKKETSYFASLFSGVKDIFNLKARNTGLMGKFKDNISTLNLKKEISSDPARFIKELDTGLAILDKTVKFITGEKLSNDDSAKVQGLLKDIENGVNANLSILPNSVIGKSVFEIIKTLSEHTFINRDGLFSVFSKKSCLQLHTNLAAYLRNKVQAAVDEYHTEAYAKAKKATESFNGVRDEALKNLDQVKSTIEGNVTKNDLKAIALEGKTGLANINEELKNVKEKVESALTSSQVVLEIVKRFNDGTDKFLKNKSLESTIKNLQVFSNQIGNKLKNKGEDISSKINTLAGFEQFLSDAQNNENKNQNEYKDKIQFLDGVIKYFKELEINTTSLESLKSYLTVQEEYSKTLNEMQEIENNIKALADLKEGLSAEKIEEQKTALESNIKALEELKVKMKPLQAKFKELTISEKVVNEVLVKGTEKVVLTEAFSSLHSHLKGYISKDVDINSKEFTKDLSIESLSESFVSLAKNVEEAKKLKINSRADSFRNKFFSNKVSILISATEGQTISLNAEEANDLKKVVETSNEKRISTIFNDPLAHTKTKGMIALNFSSFLAYFFPEESNKLTLAIEQKDQEAQNKLESKIISIINDMFKENPSALKGKLIGAINQKEAGSGKEVNHAEVLEFKEAYAKYFNSKVEEAFKRSNTEEKKINLDSTFKICMVEGAKQEVKSYFLSGQEEVKYNINTTGNTSSYLTDIYSATSKFLNNVKELSKLLEADNEELPKSPAYSLLFTKTLDNIKNLEKFRKLSEEEKEDYCEKFLIMTFNRIKNVADQIKKLLPNLENNISNPNSLNWKIVDKLIKPFIATEKINRENTLKILKFLAEYDSSQEYGLAALDFTDLSDNKSISTKKKVQHRWEDSVRFNILAYIHANLLSNNLSQLEEGPNVLAADNSLSKHVNTTGWFKGTGIVKVTYVENTGLKGKTEETRYEDGIMRVLGKVSNSSSKEEYTKSVIENNNSFIEVSN